MRYSVTQATLADIFTRGPEVNKVYDNFITTFSIHTTNPLFLVSSHSSHNVEQAMQNYVFLLIKRLNIMCRGEQNASKVNLLYQLTFDNGLCDAELS